MCRLLKYWIGLEASCIESVILVGNLRVRVNDDDGVRKEIKEDSRKIRIKI
jgi:hypothetical protein